MAASKPRVDDAAGDASLVTAFTEFAARLGTAAGERSEGFHRADDDCPEFVLNARHDALRAAYEAVERIARRTA